VVWVNKSDNTVDKTLYIIYLSGELFKEYDSIQDYFYLHYNIKKPALGMHCTLLRFYSDSNENILLTEFNKLTASLNQVKANLDEPAIFANNNIVLKLYKSNELKDLHNKCIDVFFKYKLPDREAKYIEDDYNPHLTLCHVQDKNLSLDKLLIFLNHKEILLDKINFAKKVSSYTILAERPLIS